ncbi:MAG: hypothetical protein ACFB3T_08455 [Geminicoccaceae bacterium]
MLTSRHLAVPALAGLLGCAAVDVETARQGALDQPTHALAEPRTPGPQLAADDVLALARDQAAPLIGLSDTQLQDLLGQPDFRRHERPAALWQYALSACIVDIYLYENDAGAYRSVFVDFRARTPDAIGQCQPASASLSALRRARGRS